MESVLRHVRDIQTADKRCLENTLGESLRDDQRVFIMVFTPNALPDEQRRRDAIADAAAVAQQAERNAAALGVSSAEADSAVDEAMQQSRACSPMSGCNAYTV